MLAFGVYTLHSIECGQAFSNKVKQVSPVFKAWGCRSWGVEFECRTWVVAFGVQHLGCTDGKIECSQCFSTRVKQISTLFTALGV